MNRSSRLALAIGGLAMLAAIAACGGDSAASTTSSTAAPATRIAPVATATAPEASPTAATAAIATAQPSATVPLSPSAVVSTAAAAPPPPTQAPPAEQSLTVIAKGVKFLPNALSAAAGATLHLTLDNQDAGVSHDIVIYAPSGTQLAATDAADGPIQQPLTFAVDAAGRYAFKCSVHPLQMTGTIAVE